VACVAKTKIMKVTCINVSDQSTSMLSRAK